VSKYGRHEEFAVKRPEGFDPQSRRPVQPPVAQPKPAKAQKPPKAPKPAKAQKPAKASTTPHPAKAPTVHPSIRDRHEHPAVDVRAARKAARLAARERKRFERGEVRRFTRRTRTRRTLWLTIAGIVVTLAVVLGVAIFSPLLALRDIEVEGTSRIEKAEVIAAIDGQLGTPLALLDNQRIVRELSDFALIRSFVTETVPPGTLVIHIVEREPVAVIAAGERFAFIDPAGVVVRTMTERPDDLPLIKVDGEATAGNVAFDSIVEVLLALPDKLLARVNSVTASTKDDVTFEFRGKGQTVVWGSVDLSAQKARVLDTLLGLKNASTVKKYDIRAPESVVITR
jgi:cell division protein FtsQ